MAFLYGLLLTVIVAAVGLGILALIGKFWRGVPTSGHIADAHQRVADERDRVNAQNAAADEIIAEARYRDQGARIAPPTVTPPGELPYKASGYTTDEIEEFYRNRG